jgi:hypothetical protein
MARLHTGALPVLRHPQLNRPNPVTMFRTHSRHGLTPLRCTLLISLSVVALFGCGTSTSVASDAGDEPTLPMLDPCPSAPDLTPKIPCTELGRVCEYSNDAVPLCNGAQTCLLDGGWQDLRNSLPCPRPSDCPPSPPSGSCGGLIFRNEICSYPDAGVDCVCAQCLPGKQLLTWSCFTPTPTCAQRSLLGTACSDPTARCEYPPSCCGAFLEKCERGVWTQEQQQACPP